MSGISAVGAGLQGPAKMTNAAAGPVAGGAANTAPAGQAANAGAAGPAQQTGQLNSATQVHQQVNDMLGQIDPGLQLNHTLKLLLAAIILQALSGRDHHDGPLDTAAAFVGASAAANALTGLAAFGQQTIASSTAVQASASPASVQATPYAQQATDLPQQQTVNLQA